jgi:long-chain acyl-CoA synthetase
VLTDKLVGAKIRERTGGRLRFFVSGGAALAPEVAEFYMAMGLTVLQGYGLTETSGGTVLNRPENNKYWTVGEPLDIDVKLADDGEIWIKGDGLMTGYFNLPEETAAVMTDDGWFKTGDIGEYEGKNLKITDRKKDLLVLGNGKNVAPQMIENRLKSSPLITEAVCFGDGMEYVCALVVPNFEAVKAIAASKGIQVTTDAALIESDEVKKLIKAEVDKVNKTLASFEVVKKHALLPTAFSLDSGELTPTFKVKRKFVKEKYAEKLATLR